jgi:hypothetical protein
MAGSPVPSLNLLGQNPSLSVFVNVCEKQELLPPAYF